MSQFMKISNKIPKNYHQLNQYQSKLWKYDIIMLINEMEFNKAWVDVSFDFHKLFCVYTFPPLTSNPGSVPDSPCMQHRKLFQSEVYTEVNVFSWEAKPGVCKVTNQASRISITWHFTISKLLLLLLIIQSAFSKYVVLVLWYSLSEPYFKSFYIIKFYGFNTVIH